jgi:hypothetical protein
LSRTTIAGAATELYNSLTVDDDGNPEASLVTAGVAKVYPFEPGASGVAKPASITLTFAGWDPTNWRWTVRVYVGDQNPLVAQDMMVAIVSAADALLRDGVAFGPSEGDVQWLDEVQTWMASSEVLVGREDGF